MEKSAKLAGQGTGAANTLSYNNLALHILLVTILVLHAQLVKHMAISGFCFFWRPPAREDDADGEGEGHAILEPMSCSLQLATLTGAYYGQATVTLLA